MPDPVDSHEVKKQAIIRLDVGGRMFRILKGTVERYPESLLAKLVDGSQIW